MTSKIIKDKTKKNIKELMKATSSKTEEIQDSKNKTKKAMTTKDPSPKDAITREPTEISKGELDNWLGVESSESSDEEDERALENKILQILNVKKGLFQAAKVVVQKQ